MPAKIYDWMWESDSPLPWRKVAMLLIALVVPATIAISVLGRPGAIAFVAAMPACLAAQDAGLRVSALVTLVTGMAGFLSLGAPDMALMIAPLLGLMVGICGAFGMATAAIRGLLIWPIFTSPILPTDQTPMLFGIFVLSMLWSMGTVWAFGNAAAGGTEDEESDEYAAVFGVVLAVGVTISVWVGGRFFGDHGFWFPLTFVILFLPPHGTLFSRTVKRSIGTVIGTAIALALAALVDTTWVLVSVGALCLALGFRMLPYNYTVFTTLLTVAVLEVLALVSEVDRLAIERVGTMAAAAALTFALGLVAWMVLRLFAPHALKDLQEIGIEDPPLAGQRQRDSSASATRAG